MGFCVRRADLGEAAQVTAVLTDTWKAAYRGIIDDAFLDALAVDEKASTTPRMTEASTPLPKRAASRPIAA